MLRLTHHERLPGRLMRQIPEGVQEIFDAADLLLIFSLKVGHQAPTSVLEFLRQQLCLALRAGHQFMQTRAVAKIDPNPNKLVKVQPPDHTQSVATISDGQTLLERGARPGKRACRWSQ